MTIGSQLKMYRQSLKMNQTDFSKKLLIEQHQLSYYESGTRLIPPELLDDLIDAEIIKDPSKVLKKELKDIINSMTAHDVMSLTEYLKSQTQKEVK